MKTVTADFVVMAEQLMTHAENSIENMAAEDIKTKDEVIRIKNDLQTVRHKKAILQNINSEMEKDVKTIQDMEHYALKRYKKENSAKKKLAFISRLFRSGKSMKTSSSDEDIINDDIITIMSKSVEETNLEDAQIKLMQITEKIRTLKLNATDLDNYPDPGLRKKYCFLLIFFVDLEQKREDAENNYFAAKLARDNCEADLRKRYIFLQLTS